MIYTQNWHLSSLLEIVPTSTWAEHATIAYWNYQEEWHDVYTTITLIFCISIPKITPLK